MGSYLENIKNTIISNYGIRFFPKQKKKFREFIMNELNSLDFECEEVSGNMVAGNVEEAEYIITAHYDTPGIMPHWMNYIIKYFGHTRQLSFSILLVIMFFLLHYFRLYIINNILFLWILFIFIPNKNNYNDNTSGVLTLLNIAHQISMSSEKESLKGKIALVFFNNEEWGLLGSAAMKKYWVKNKISLEEKKIINVDCVGVGDLIMLTHGEKSNLVEMLQNTLKDSSKGKEIIKYKYKVIPLSDEYNFKEHNITGIIFCNKTKVPGGYYIPYVHSSKDKIVELENINWLTREIIKLI